MVIGLSLQWRRRIKERLLFIYYLSCYDAHSKPKQRIQKVHYSKHKGTDVTNTPEKKGVPLGEPMEKGDYYTHYKALF